MELTNQKPTFNDPEKHHGQRRKCWLKTSIYCLSHNVFLMFPKTNFGLFQNERLCRRQFSYLVKMVESYPKRIENTVGKGEIARYKQFLHFPQCFRKTKFHKRKKPGLVWERVKQLHGFVTSYYFQLVHPKICCLVKN